MALGGGTAAVTLATRTAALEEAGLLPDGKKAVLVLKPHSDKPDFEFKNEALRDIGALGPVLGSFENEPAHVNIFIEHFPKGKQLPA